jgi:AcrR family transcriptional regulator
MPRTRPYHHGNLKQALVAAAIELIRRAGPHGFTLREVARRAGVSHNAPYRHFRRRDDLLAEVAAEGFERLTKSMNEAAARGASPIERFQLSGWGYVHFALRYPEHFTVMFDRPGILKSSARCKEAGGKAFAALLGFVRDCQEAAVLSPGDAQPIALMAWSVVHGVSKLAISGQLPFSTQAKVLEFTSSLTRTLAWGLAQEPPGVAIPGPMPPP